MTQHDDRHTMGTTAAGSLHRLLRKAASLMLATAMLISFAPRRARAQTTDNARTDAGISQLRADFSRTALGRDVLKFANTNGIAIGYDSTLQNRGELAEYNPATGKAVVLPEIAPEEAVLDLSHEARHGWQDKVLKFAQVEEEKLTPEQRWALRRYMEADACAFSAYFEAHRIKELGVKTDTLTSQTEAKAAIKMAAELDSPDGLTQDEYRKLAFEPCLGKLSSYNDAHLKYIGDKIAETDKDLAAAQQSPDIARRLMTAFEKAQDDKAFETYLRRFGGTSWDREAATGLQTPAVDQDTILYKYPRRDSDPETSITFPRRRDAQLGALSDQYDTQVRKVDNLLRGQPLAPPK